MELEYWTLILIVSLSIYFGICRNANTNANNNSLINVDTSLTLKAIACMVIIAYHFSLRVENDDLLIKLFGMGGTWALSIFLLLSSYGISQSEKIKKYEFKSYFKHRILKLLIPFWVCIFIVVLFYAILSPSITEEAIISKARLGEAFPHFSDSTWMDYFLYIVGLKSISAGNWFVLVILYAYILFYVVSTYIGYDKRRLFVLYYSMGLIAFGLLTSYLDWPAHYWRNLWALALGLFLSLYENELLKIKRLRFILWLFTNIVLVIDWLFIHCCDYTYIVFANLALVSIILFQRLFSLYSLKKRSIVLCLSLISYQIYLVHGAILNIQWYMFGSHNSLLLVVVFSILLAWLCYKLKNYVLYA